MNSLKQRPLDEIITLHNEIDGQCRVILQKAVRIGELLTEQKAKLPHGEFTPWIETNLPFTVRTAQNYMKVYRERDTLKSENVSLLTEGYRLLQGPTGPMKPKTLFARTQELAERRLKLERDAGGAMCEINGLLRSGEGIAGTAEPNIVFHIERDVLTVFELREEVGRGYTKRRYKKDPDLWWHLDKHVGIGRVTAIWDYDWPTGGLEQRALSLHDRLMSLYGRLCDVCGELMGTLEPKAGLPELPGRHG